MPAGRPALYCVETAQKICERLAEGESLRQICRDESMPCISTVMKWNREIPEFSQHYAKAREDQFEHWAEEIIEIADDGSNDWITRESESGRIDKIADSEHINRSRLRVDARKWLLSKLASKRFGDRISTELSGPGGGPVETKDVSELSDLDRARRVAFLLAQGLRAAETAPSGNPAGSPSAISNKQE